jgi:hypothetical protein
VKRSAIIKLRAAPSAPLVKDSQIVSNLVHLERFRHVSSG